MKNFLKLKQKVKSIQFRMFIILCISTILAISTLIIINNVVLEVFYKYSKIGTSKKIYQELNDYYNSAVKYEIKTEIRNLEIQNNIDILIEDEDGEIVYCFNREILRDVSELENSGDSQEISDENGKIIIDSINSLDKRNTNKCLLMHASLDNGYQLYIKIPIMPIKESVKISNQTLIFIGIMMVIVSAILSLIISKQFTKPLIELNNITKKMAKLDFSEKYKIKNSEDEVNALGRNINEMSDKLEKTIRQLRENNNQLERDIEEKSKIDEMRKQFVSDVSHELKTPIALIQGYAEGLLDNVNSDDESRKFYAEVILDEAEKMNQMVLKLLELMKLEYNERKFNDREFNLNELILEEIKRETVVLNEKNIKITYNENKNLIAYADQEYIEQVISNYLTNAIKNCKEIDGIKEIKIRTREKEDNKIRVYVFNTGDKIEDEYIDKIWDRFYKVDKSRNRESGGTGIGLSLVKAIMNNYHNKYGVRNLDNGVEFYCDINKKSNENDNTKS